MTRDIGRDIRKHTGTSQAMAMREEQQRKPMTDQPAPRELKPCPFCGAEPTWNFIPAHEHHMLMPNPETGRMEKMPPAGDTCIIECGCGSGMIDASAATVTERWNRRAESAAPAPETRPRLTYSLRDDGVLCVRFDGDPSRRAELEAVLDASGEAPAPETPRTTDQAVPEAFSCTAPFIRPFHVDPCREWCRNEMACIISRRMESVPNVATQAMMKAGSYVLYHELEGRAGSMDDAHRIYRAMLRAWRIESKSIASPPAAPRTMAAQPAALLDALRRIRSYCWNADSLGETDDVCEAVLAMVEAALAESTAAPIAQGNDVADDLQVEHGYTPEQAVAMAQVIANGVAKGREMAAQADVQDATRDVLAERKRQIEVEGWTPEHDDAEHYNRELAVAAACYCLIEQVPGYVDKLWPWDTFKDRGPRRNLVRAGALILAEIERIDRAAIAAQADKGAV